MTVVKHGLDLVSIVDIDVISALPIIPDVAIHYRCGDNLLLPFYGFVRFSTLKNLIPVSAGTIYILSDPPSRYHNKEHSKEFQKICDHVLHALFRYVKNNFPTAITVLKRGSGSILQDLAILTFANTTICSISTFCLWPAVANNGSAFYPQSLLVLEGDISIDLGFRWIPKGNIILMNGLSHLKPEEVLHLLQMG